MRISNRELKKLKESLKPDYWERNSVLKESCLSIVNMIEEIINEIEKINKELKNKVDLPDGCC